MPSKELLALRMLESVGICVALVCALANSRTLRSARRTHRTAVLNGTDPIAIIWTKIQCRGKWCLFAVQVLIVAMSIYRMKQVFIGPLLVNSIIFMTFGLAQRVIAVLVAWTAWENARAFERLRDGP